MRLFEISFGAKVPFEWVRQSPEHCRADFESQGRRYFVDFYTGNWDGTPCWMFQFGIHQPDKEASTMRMTKLKNPYSVLSTVKAVFDDFMQRKHPDCLAFYDGDRIPSRMRWYGVFARYVADRYGYRQDDAMMQKAMRTLTRSPDTFIWILKRQATLGEGAEMTVVPVLYHGTCEDNAAHLMQHGWQPHSGMSGGNQGQTRYLYLSTDREDALWFAQEKGCDTVLAVHNIPRDSLIVDPEDGIGDTVEAELHLSHGLPGKLALIKPLPASHFQLHQPLGEGAGQPLPATPENIAAAKSFVFGKWRERAKELGRDDPVDLSDACKFTSLFAATVFGGTMRGNFFHQWVALPDGRTLDLNDEAADVITMLRGEIPDDAKDYASSMGKKLPSSLYTPDERHMRSRGNRQSMASVRLRVQQWADEFLKRRTTLGEARIMKTYRVAWGRNQYAHLGTETVKASSERDARRQVRQSLEDRYFSHHGMKILYVTAVDADQTLTEAGGYDLPRQLRPWLTGRCFDFALALSERMPNAEFIAIGSAKYPDHVALRWNGRYYDARGEMDEPTFLTLHRQGHEYDAEDIVPISRDEVELHAGVAGFPPPYKGNRDIAEARRAVREVFGK